MVNPLLLGGLVVAVTGLLMVLDVGVGQGVPHLHWEVPPGYEFKASLVGGFSAGMSRALSRIITFPLDTIKTRQQAVLNERGVTAGVALEHAKHVRMNHLWDGVVPMLLIAGPANAAFFATYDYVVALCNSQHLFVGSAWLLELFAAFVASFPANCIRIPAERVKQLTQVGADRNSWVAFVSVLEDQGPGGLYVGGKAHLAREIPFNAMQLMTYEQLSALLAGLHHSSYWDKMWTGAVAAGVASFTTQPFDTVKTCDMIDKEGTVAKQGFFGKARIIVRDFGVQGLFLGWLPRFALCSVGGSIFFAAEQLAKQLVHMR